MGTVPKILSTSSLLPSETLKHEFVRRRASVRCLFVRVWNVAVVMSNFPGRGVFVGQMQFKDCMKKNIESPSYRGIIIRYYFFKRCSSRRAGHPAILTCRWFCCRKFFFCLLKGLLVGLKTNPLYLHLHILLLPSDFFFSALTSLFCYVCLNISKIFYCSPVQLDRMSVMQTCRPHFSW